MKPQPLAATRGGLVIETSWGPQFLSAGTARSVAPWTAPLPVPGLAPPAQGVAVIEDKVATVLKVGRDDREMILCETDAGWVALAGARVIACGSFPEANGGASVVWEGREVQPLDVDALLVEAERAMWRVRTRDEGSR